MASAETLETRLLLNEYTNLKRLIDAHKKHNAAVPYTAPFPNPAFSTQRKHAAYFPPGNKFIRNNSPSKIQSSYRFNRSESATRTLKRTYDGSHSRSSLITPHDSIARRNVSGGGESRKPSQTKISEPFVTELRPTVQKTFTKYDSERSQSQTKFPPSVKIVQSLVSKAHNSRFKLQKINHGNVSASKATVIRRNLKVSDELVKSSQAKISEPVPSNPQSIVQKPLMKFETKSSHFQNKSPIPVKNVPSVTSKVLNSRFKLQKINQGTALGSPATSSPIAKPQKKLQSKYKIVVSREKSCLRQSPSNVKKRVLLKRSSSSSKYSWASKKSTSIQEGPALRSTLTLNKAPINLSGSKSNLFKSKYAISKCNAVRTSPKLVRHVNKYSVTYSPLKLKKETTHSGTKFKSDSSLFRSRLQQCPPKKLIGSIATGKPKLNESLKGKSELVVIGGILYKSSKTKLSRTENMKPNRVNASHSTPVKRSSSAGMKKQRIVTVRGIKFAMDLNRKVLKRLPFQEPKRVIAKQTPNVTNKLSRSLTRIDIGGETYIQTRPGVLLRSSASQLRTMANRVLNRSILRSKVAKHKFQQFCLFFNKFGRCNNKEKGICRYIHDPEKIAVCKRYLRGQCKVENCPFAHEACPSKMPVCTFFLHGRCNNDSCNYRHVNVNPNADICMDFAKGYCPLGDECKKWHVTSCPQFEQSGNCNRGEKCPLNHRRRRMNKPNVTAAEIPAIATSSSHNKRPLETLDLDNGLDERPTKRLPSFISLSDDLLISEDAEVKHPGAGDPLQIKPVFLKHHE